MSNIWAYLKSLARHWLSFVVFAGPGAIVAWIVTASGIHLPPVVWITIVFIGFAIAGFQAHRDVEKERDEAVAKLAERSSRRNVREGLALLLEEGQGLQAEIQESLKTRTTSVTSMGGIASYQQTEDYSDTDWQPALRDWQQRVVHYLDANLDASYSALFMSSAGIAPSGHVYFNHEEHLGNVRTSLSMQLERLASFIARLPD